MDRTISEKESVVFERRTQEKDEVSGEHSADTRDMNSSIAHNSLLDYRIFEKASWFALRHRIDVFAEHTVWIIEDIKESAPKRNGQLLAGYGSELRNACSPVGAAGLARLANVVTKRGQFYDFEDIDTLIVKLERCFGRTVENLYGKMLKRDTASLRN